jgi:hypothetical protein
MKSTSGTTRIITAGAVVLIIGLAMAVFAQGTGKTDSDPSKWGIRLLLGGRDKEAANVSLDSLKSSVQGRDKKTYKVHYHDADKDWKDGEAQFAISDMSSARREVGGGGSPKSGLITSGSTSTQKVAFATLDDLKAFTSTLASPTPAPSPSP